MDELEEVPKSDIHRTSIAVDGLGAQWDDRFVPTKGREADGDSSHLTPPADLHRTKPNRRVMGETKSRKW